MTSGIIATIIFGSLILVSGILMIIFRKKVFNIPDYKTDYGIKVYSDFPMTGYEKIDPAINKIFEYLNTNGRTLWKDDLKLLTIKVINDKDMGYLAKLITKKDILLDGVMYCNIISLRKLKGNNIIVDTALIHELVHFILMSLGLDPDAEHTKDIYWGRNGIVYKVLRGL